MLNASSFALTAPWEAKHPTVSLPLVLMGTYFLSLTDMLRRVLSLVKFHFPGRKIKYGGHELFTVFFFASKCAWIITQYWYIHTYKYIHATHTQKYTTCVQANTHFYHILRTHHIITGPQVHDSLKPTLHIFFNALEMRFFFFACVLLGISGEHWAYPPTCDLVITTGHQERACQWHF